jgi:hypothetical protein
MILTWRYQIYKKIIKKHRFNDEKHSKEEPSTALIKKMLIYDVYRPGI